MGLESPFLDPLVTMNKLSLLVSFTMHLLYDLSDLEIISRTYWQGIPETLRISGTRVRTT